MKAKRAFLIGSVVLWLINSIWLFNRYLTYGISLNPDWFPIAIHFLVLSIFLVYYLHYSGRGPLVTQLIVELFDTENPEKAIDDLATSFPYTAIGFLVLMLSITVSLDTSPITNVANQSYGLILDGIGGFLLAREFLNQRYSEAVGGTITAGADPESLMDQIWGITLLTGGFSLQYIAILPWDLLS